MQKDNKRVKNKVPVKVRKEKDETCCAHKLADCYFLKIKIESFNAKELAFAAPCNCLRFCVHDDNY